MTHNNRTVFLAEANISLTIFNFYNCSLTSFSTFTHYAQ